MQSVAPSTTGVAITNPLVLYRTLVATKKIAPDPAQYRLAVHLQKLYERLKDYEPPVEYGHRLKQLSRFVHGQDDSIRPRAERFSTGGIWKSLLNQKENKNSLALTRTLTSRETAIELDSPKGLMLHGEVGTGKSMLIDLFADCLPSRKKRRWHFNTFMLETFSRLEELRQRRSSQAMPGVSVSDDEYSLLWLARDLVQTSPVLFLDEFQLPDRVASKLISNLITSFFQLGGVLVATSNRMPEELDKAAGMNFVAQSSPMDSIRSVLGFPTRSVPSGNKSEFADFLEVLRARCEVWEMESTKDYRRGKVEAEDVLAGHASGSNDSAASGCQDKGVLEDSNESCRDAAIPEYYLVKPSGTDTLRSSPNWLTSLERAQLQATGEKGQIPWSNSAMQIYGRTVAIPKQHNGVTSWTFDELCGSKLGSADYTTLASTFHTLILTDVPVMNFSQKNEATRFITLLDALYEARCKLLITASAGPDDIFFPESRASSSAGGSLDTTKQQQQGDDDGQDAVHAETFSEAYQDVNEPFRPNVSSYHAASKTGPDYNHARFAGILSDDALEDDPPNRMRRLSCSPPEELGCDHHHKSPDFSQAGVFTGQDERFAYKRARSRLWEMCSAKWWARTEEGWWRPLPKEVRRWERSSSEQLIRSLHQQKGDMESLSMDGEGMGMARDINEEKDEVLFWHGSSPFRTVTELPPKISWTHIWGTMKWGKRAGPWGQGVEGLAGRGKKDEDK